MILICDSKLLSYNVSYNHERPLTDLFEELMSTISEIEYIKDDKVSKVIFVFDYGKSSFRKGMYPGYKGGRNYSLSPEDFQDNYRYKLPELCYALGISVVGVDGVEADDLAGIMLANYKGVEDVVCITEDADWLQLGIGRDYVSIYGPKKRKFLTTDSKSKAQFLVEKTMRGDTSDAIFGVYGCGKEAFKKFKGSSFANPKSFKGLHSDQVSFLEDEYLDFLEAHPRMKVHDKYKAIGISNFVELFQFNMDLGEIFEDFGKMDDLQISVFKNIMKGLHNDTRLPKAEVSTIAHKMAGNRVGMFGDPADLPEEVVKYFQGICDD